MAADYLDTAWIGAKRQADEQLSAYQKNLSGVVLTGCGDSYFAARGVEESFAEWAELPVWGVPAMQAARYLLPRAGLDWQRMLVIGISVSGEVARTIEALEIAASRGAACLAITANPLSSLASAADLCLELQAPDLPPGPGLLSYLGTMLTAYAAARSLAAPQMKQLIDLQIGELPAALQRWLPEQIALGESFAQAVDGCSPPVFLGSGPAAGTALFAAAKLTEAAGEAAWAQDVEEWAHIEYFGDPPAAPVWLLSAGGRARGREDEVLAAARAIGRQVVVSRWHAADDRDWRMHELLAPLVLWGGPAVFAETRARLSRALPFRAFGGGRAPAEGGGASRIRSSLRLTLEDLQPAAE